MAQGAPVVCRSPGCGQAHKNKNGHCDTHKAQATAYRHTKTTSQRGYGAAWQRVRLVALKRDYHLCQPCKANSHITAATEVDHVVPKYRGGTDAIGNLQSICKACHKIKSISESVEGRGA
jgi:5-methylcytosine-specific restriction protein A